MRSGRTERIWETPAAAAFACIAIGTDNMELRRTDFGGGYTFLNPMTDTEFSAVGGWGRTGVIPHELRVPARQMLLEQLFDSAEIL